MSLERPTARVSREKNESVYKLTVKGALFPETCKALCLALDEIDYSARMTVYEPHGHSWNSSIAVRAECAGRVLRIFDSAPPSKAPN